MIDGPVFGLALTHMIGFINRRNESTRRLSQHLISRLKNEEEKRYHHQHKNILLGKHEHDVPENFIAFLYHEKLEAANNNCAVKSFAEREAQRLQSRHNGISY